MRLAMLVAAMIGAFAMAGGSTQADTVAAMSGHGWPGHFDTCFSSSWSMMQNNCATTRLLIIPAQARRPGYSSVLVRAAGNNISTGTNCQGITTFASFFGNFASSFTPIVSTSASQSTQVLGLGALPVFPGDVMHFECFVAPTGGRVFMVDFE